MLYILHCWVAFRVNRVFKNDGCVVSLVKKEWSNYVGSQGNLEKFIHGEGKLYKEFGSHTEGASKSSIHKFTSDADQV